MSLIKVMIRNDQQYDCSYEQVIFIHKQKKCLLSKKKDKKVGLSHHTARMKNKLQNSNMSH